MLAFVEPGQGLVVMINANDNSTTMTRIAGRRGPQGTGGRRAVGGHARGDEDGCRQTIALEDVTGRYELTNNNMLTLVAHDGQPCSHDVSGLRDEEFLFMGRRSLRLQQIGTSAFASCASPTGAVVGLAWIGDIGQERQIPRIGPLFASIDAGVDRGDPDPSVHEYSGSNGFKRTGKRVGIGRERPSIPRA